MQDTHTEVTTSRSNADTKKLTRALGSTRVQQAAAAVHSNTNEDDDDLSTSNSSSNNNNSNSKIPAFLMSGLGTTIKLLQKNSKGKASVRSLIVPETSKIASKTSIDSDQLKKEAEQAARNKMFILEAQLAEEEAGNDELIPVHMTPMKPLLPGQQAKTGGTTIKKKKERKINSRAAGLSNEHLSQFTSDVRPGGNMRFARRGFGGRN